MSLTRAKRLFFLGLIGSLSVTALLAIGFLLLGEFDETTARILLTTALLSLFSLFSLPAGVLLDQSRARALAWAVLGLSGVAFALALVLTWGNWEGDGNETVAKALATAGSLAAAASQAALTTSRRRPEDGDAVRLLYLASLLLAAVLAVLISVAAWREVDAEGYYRALGAVVIADVLLVIVQSIARRLAPPQAPEPPGRRLVFTLDRAPSDDAVEAASRALRDTGVRVERVDLSG